MNLSPVARLKKTWAKVKTAKFDVLEVGPRLPVSACGGWPPRACSAGWRWAVEPLPWPHWGPVA